MQIKKVLLYVASFIAYSMAMLFGGIVVWASVMSLNPFIAVPGILLTAIHFAGCAKITDKAMNYR